jgi:hypothetical protein
MLRNQLLAVLGIHDIESEGHAFLTVLLDSLLDSLGTICQRKSTGYTRQLTLPPPRVSSKWLRLRLLEQTSEQLLDRYRNHLFVSHSLLRGTGCDVPPVMIAVLPFNFPEPLYYLVSFTPPSW